MDNEIWIPIQSENGLFSISSCARIKNNTTGKILKQSVGKTGYYQIVTKIGGRNGRNRLFRVHREYAIAFIPNPHGLPQVNHKDGNKLNNHVDNLEWCTASENIKHSIKMGLHPTGSDVHTHKLTETQVMQIRELYKPYSRIYGTVRLAEQFGVSQRTISSIILRETWKC